MEDELSERREGWVVVVLANATDYYSTSKYLIIQLPNQLERGVEDELSERREGWVVVVLANATDYYSTSKYLIIQLPNQLDPP